MSAQLEIEAIMAGFGLVAAIVPFGFIIWESLHPPREDLEWVEAHLLASHPPNRGTSQYLETIRPMDGIGRDLSFEISNLAKDDAIKAERLTKMTRSLTILTLLFLPGSLISGLFATELFSWDSNEILEEKIIDLNIRPRFGLYWIISLPLMAVVLGLFYLHYSFAPRKLKRSSIPILMSKSRLESDVASVKLLATIAMIFLPATFASTLFGMNLDLGTPKHSVTEDMQQFSLEWAIILSLTTIPVFLYFAWGFRKPHKPDSASSPIRANRYEAQSDNARVGAVAILTALFLLATFAFCPVPQSFIDLEASERLDAPTVAHAVLAQIDLFRVVIPGVAMLFAILTCCIWALNAQGKQSISEALASIRFRDGTHKLKVILLLATCFALIIQLPATLVTPTIRYRDFAKILVAVFLLIVGLTISRPLHQPIMDGVESVCKLVYGRLKAASSSMHMTGNTFLASLAIFTALLSALLAMIQFILALQEARSLYPSDLEKLEDYTFSFPTFVLFWTITIPTTIITFGIFSLWTWVQSRRLKFGTRARKIPVESVNETLSAQGLSSASLVLIPRGSISVLLLFRIFSDGVKSAFGKGNKLGTGVSSTLSLSVIPITLGFRTLYNWWSNLKRQGQNSQRDTSSNHQDNTFASGGTKSESISKSRINKLDNHPRGGPSSLESRSMAQIFHQPTMAAPPLRVIKGFLA